MRTSCAQLARRLARILRTARPQTRTDTRTPRSRLAHSTCAHLAQSLRSVTYLEFLCKYLAAHPHPMPSPKTPQPSSQSQIGTRTTAVVQRAEHAVHAGLEQRLATLRRVHVLSVAPLPECASVVTPHAGGDRATGAEVSAGAEEEACHGPHQASIHDVSMSFLQAH